MDLGLADLDMSSLAFVFVRPHSVYAGAGTYQALGRAVLSNTRNASGSPFDLCFFH